MKNLGIFRWFFTLFLVVLSATWIDYIVHYQLYFYGLVFSFEWAVPYWVAMTVLFVTAVSRSPPRTGYSEEKRRDTRQLAHYWALPWSGSTLEGISIFSGGFLHRSFPPTSLEWWWSPFHWALGLDLRTSDQLVYVSAMTTILAVLWIGWWIYIRRKWQRSFITELIVFHQTTHYRKTGTYRHGLAYLRHIFTSKFMFKSRPRIRKNL